jgi:hypothetical protein
MFNLHKCNAHYKNVNGLSLKSINESFNESEGESN